jgi:hypothetical protein
MGEVRQGKADGAGAEGADAQEVAPAQTVAEPHALVALEA